MRIGFGYDVHAFRKNRRLVIGGVELKCKVGLEGHSDADILIHSIMDALLGAAGLGDIGIHFPNYDMRYKDISSLELLRQVGDKVNKAGFKIVNIDSAIVMEKPKLSPHFQKMRENIAEALEINAGQVNVKATTSEGIGFCGRIEGAEAQSVALLE